MVIEAVALDYSPTGVLRSPDGSWPWFPIQSKVKFRVRLAKQRQKNSRLEPNPPDVIRQTFGGQILCR
jgi:hypothetical protein